MKSVALVFALAFCASAVAAPPPAPSLSVQATDIRQLEFSYGIVPGVQWYELWFRAAPGAAWVKYQERAAQRGPLFRIGVPVHLLDWRLARYYVNACNSSGCSASNEVDVDGEQLVAMGYLKPNAPTGHRYFGSNVAVSADGKTVAVLASEQLGGQQGSATVHVYRKTTATSGWRREARLLPSTVQSATAQPYLGDPIALSGDGNLLVLGTWTESGGGDSERGAVYVFRRSGTTWRLAQKMSGTDFDGNRFGYVVKVDDAGRTLAVSHRYLLGGYPPAPGTVEIFRDPEDASDQFVHYKKLEVPSAGGGVTAWCDAVALSGDGNTLVRGCGNSTSQFHVMQLHTGPDFTEGRRLAGGGTADGIDISYDGKVILFQEANYAGVYRLFSSGWASDGWFESINGTGPAGRRHLALSRDGKIAAYGSSVEYTVGLGPVYPPHQAGDENSGSGGVAVYERKTSGWVLRRLVKPGSTHASWTGHSVALGDNGRILVVGAPFDPSAAAGIDGDREDASMPERGAVWIY